MSALGLGAAALTGGLLAPEIGGLFGAGAAGLLMQAQLLAIWLSLGLVDVHRFAGCKCCWRSCLGQFLVTRAVCHRFCCRSGRIGRNSLGGAQSASYRVGGNVTGAGRTVFDTQYLYRDLHCLRRSGQPSP